MYSKRSIFGGLAVAAILSFVSFSVLADTIRLKDGSIIKGRIVRFSGGTFSVEIGEGARKRQMLFRSDEVESIQFDSPQVAVARQAPQYSGTTNDTMVKVSTGTSSAPVSSNPRVITTESIPAAKNQPSTTRSEPPASTATTTPESQPDTTSTTSVPRTTSTTPPKIGARTSVGTGSQPVSSAQPVELNVKVLADETNNGWTNSGWVARKGQRIHITADGVVSLGNGHTSSAAGLPDLPDDQKLLKAVATGALIAVIGDDNNDFIYIGAEREFTATRDGTLFLGVNKGNLREDSGSFDAKVQILPPAGK